MTIPFLSYNQSIQPASIHAYSQRLLSVSAPLASVGDFRRKVGTRNDLQGV